MLASSQVDVSGVTGAQVDESPFLSGGSGVKIYVDANNGNDGNAGTSAASAFKTLSRAIGVATDSAHLAGGIATKIILATGTYSGDVNMSGQGNTNIQNTTFVIEGAAKGQCIITGAGDISTGWTVYDAGKGIYRHAWTSDFGEEWANITTGDGTLPTNPSGTGPKKLVTVGGLNGQVSMSWTASTIANLAGYNIYRKGPGQSSYTKIGSVGSGILSYTDSTVTNSDNTNTRQYFYYVKAYDTSNAESAASNGAWADPWDPTASTYQMPVGRRNEGVYVNSVQKQQVMNLSDLNTTGEAYYVDDGYLGDSTDGFLYVRTSTALTAGTAKVEGTILPVASRSWNYLLKIDWKSNLVIRNVDFTKSRRGALNMQNSPGNVLIEDCNFTWNNLEGLSYQGLSTNPRSTKFTIQRCTFNNNGADGFGAGSVNNFVVQDDQVNYNNWRGAWAQRWSWDRQGWKCSGMYNGIIQRCDFVGNQGVGLWLDTDMQNVLVSEIQAIGNIRNGIETEALQGPVLVQKCVMANNGSNGFYISESDNITVDNNVMYKNGQGPTNASTSVLSQFRISGYSPSGRSWTKQDGTTYTSFTKNNTITNNTMVSFGTVPMYLDLYQTSSDYQNNTLKTLTASNNTYWNADGNQNLMFATSSSAYTNLAGWQNLFVTLANAQDTTASGTKWADPNLRGDYTLSHEYWGGITGDSVGSLTSAATYPNSPTYVDSFTRFESNMNLGDNYGDRIQAYLLPTVSGAYTFWVSGDNAVQLWLSTDVNPANAALIAQVPFDAATSSQTSFRQWTKYASQKSAAVTLSSTGRYYLMVLHKEGTGSDHFSVGWSKPGGSTTGPDEILNGSVLGRYYDVTTPPAAPSNLTGTVAATPSVTLNWVDNASNEDGYAVERSPDGVTWAQIGTTTPIVRTYTDSGVTAGSSYSYRVRAYNAAGNSAYANVVTAYVGAARIRGTVFNDLNGNGVLDTGETGIAGRTVFLDLNNDGVYQSAGTYTPSSGTINLAIPDNNPTGVTSTISVSGAGTVTKVTVALSITHTYDSDLTATLIGPDGTSLVLFSAVGSSGQNFTNTVFDDSASTSITAGSAPFTGTFKPSGGALSTFIGKNGSGNWQLKVVDSAAQDTGNIVSWGMTINAGETGVTTDASGNYSITNVPDGTYTVRTVVPGGWSQTAPAGNTYSVTTAYGVDASGRNFGTWVPVSATPTSLALAAASDTGVSNSDRLTKLKTGLQFVVGGTVSGATVSIFDGGTLIGSAVASGTTTTVTTTGTLADGAHSVTAVQAEAGKSTSAATGAVVVTVDTVAPRVSGVFFASSLWAGAYLSNLVSFGVATANGYAVGTGAGQNTSLPWSNVDTIRIGFNDAVYVSAGNLLVTGINTASYGLTGYSYASQVATWKTTAALSNDRITLALSDTVSDAAGNLLDGEWTNASSVFPSGNGAAGGPFNFAVNVLPGDVNASGGVSTTDVSQVKLASGKAVSSSNWRCDVNGSNAINISDVNYVKSRTPSALPGASGSVSAPVSGGTASSNPSTLSLLDQLLNGGSSLLK